jgi:hypothetical protein
MKKIQGGKMKKVTTIQGPKDIWGTQTVVEYGVFDEIPKSMLAGKIISVEHVMVVR